jgi:prepilin-type N-terminal cleavage/methylation domain-containing protein
MISAQPWARYNKGMMEQKGRAAGARQGFSLVEILVVIGVTLALSAITLVYTAGTRDIVNLSVEQAHVAQYLSRAKSQALASYAQVGTACGYGVYIASTETMQIFSYTDATNCAPASLTAASIRNAGNRTVTDTSPLARGVLFDTGNGVVEAVLFVPPDPTTYYIVRGNGNLNPGGSGSVVLRTPGNNTSTVRVSSAGQITF